MDDAYGAKLWEILPEGVEISGVGHDDTVILDGCRAANVRWKSFTPVANTRRPSWGRWFAEVSLRLTGFTFFLGIILVSIPNYTGLPGLTPWGAAGVFFIIWSIILSFLSPWLLRMLYLGKFWDQQCWLFGFEGYMPIETIESQIFGGRLCRLRWTPYASQLSRHHRNEYNECVADDPTTDPEVRALIERSKNAGPGEQRLFTLVDTGMHHPRLPHLWHRLLTLIRQHDSHLVPRCSSTDVLPHGRFGRWHEAHRRLLIRLDHLDHVPRNGAAHGDQIRRQNVAHWPSQGWLQAFTAHGGSPPPSW